MELMQQVMELLPRLDPRSDLSLKPSLTQLAAMAASDPASLSAVSNFTISRPGIGSVCWLEEVRFHWVHRIILQQSECPSPQLLLLSKCCGQWSVPFLLLLKFALVEGIDQKMVYCSCEAAL